jgi:hypothetical protein
MRQSFYLAFFLGALFASSGARAAACVYDQSSTIGIVPGGNTWIEKITSTGADLVGSIDVHFSGTASNTAYVGVYADNAGAPGTLLASSAETAISDGWNTINFSAGVSLSGATTYWIAVGADSPSVHHSSTFNGSAVVVMTGAYGALTDNPSVFSTGTTDSFAVRLGSCVAATPTLTPGAAGTSTATSLPSSTVSATFTDSRTATTSPTPSATRTATGSATPTATPSATRTATASATPSATPSSTRTATGSATPTATPTSTSTHSPTRTATASATPTATSTSTSTHSPTRTATPTLSPSFTASPSFTETPSATVTSTASPTATATSSSTATPSATPTSTATATASVTESFTASPSFTESPTQTPIVFPTAIVCEINQEDLGLSRLDSFVKSSAPAAPGLAAVAPQPARSGLPVCVVFNQDLESYGLSLHALDGRQVARLAGSGSRACLAAPAPGVYVIYTEGRSRLGERFQQQAKLAVVGR